MSFAFRPHRRSGLTLVEILIALTMTLIVLGTMMTAFKFASEEMQEGRALIELANRARVVEDNLRIDLGSLTVETRVYNATAEPNGYFELVEGPIRDSTYSGTASLVSARNSFLGDCDDFMAFTARSADGVLYRGRRKIFDNATRGMGPTAIIESSLAEIAWFVTVNDNEDGPLQPPSNNAAGAPQLTVDFDDSIQVRRRVLLIRPDLSTVATDLSDAEVNNFIRNNDISVRVVPAASGGGGSDLIANGLNDLAVRRNRFAHVGSPFPNVVDFGLLQNRVASEDGDPEHNVNYGSGQTWQALPPILADIGAFDFRVYSPTARVNEVADVIVEPSDIGYSSANLVQRGAYVDLGYSRATTAPGGREDEWFIASSNKPTRTAPTPTTPFVANTWDTWTPFYERDGIDQDGILGIDQAANGRNDELPTGVNSRPLPQPSNVVDDPGERETSPPYLQPIRGMKITLRLVEKGTKQVHQVSVIHSFVPE